ncbi:MAG: DUF2007 domain-containing protein [Rhodobacteraceae bacterium]|nr:DUF2007 domain-containing protein [Paracoccaceae bacterium]
MEELLRTNDPVLISLLESILSEEDIAYFIADSNMSILEGSIGLMPRRILVDSEKIFKARRLLIEADLGHELVDGPTSSSAQ